jgi:hypothetical protein
VLLAGSLLVGCGVDVSDYSTRRGVVECRRMRVCEVGRFEHEFDADMDLCVDGIGDRLDAEAERSLKDCGYDAAEAARCLARIRNLPCDEFASGGVGRACDRVYDCAGVEAGAGGGTGNLGSGTTDPTGGGPTGGEG